MRRSLRGGQNVYQGTLPESGGIRVAETGERQAFGPYSEARARCGQEGHQSQAPQVGRGCVLGGYTS